MRFVLPARNSRSHTVLPLLGAALVPAVLVLALVCMSLNRVEETVRLPGDVARPPVKIESPAISVRISRQGEVTIAGQTVAGDTLPDAWRRERAAVRLLGFEPSQATVLLRADPDVPTSTVQQLIEQAQQAGFQQCVLRGEK